MVKIILSELRYQFFKLLSNLRILPHYELDLLSTRYLYEKHGIKKADEHFHNLAVELAENKTGLAEIKEKYDYLLRISEPESAYYNSFIHAKSRTKLVRKVLAKKVEDVKTGNVVVGIDLHGVLNVDTSKDLLMRFMEEVTKTLPVVFWVISGGATAEAIEKELSKLGYEKSKHYDRIICVADYLKRKGVTLWYDEKGFPWCDDGDWWPAKAKICEEYGVSLMIDDLPKYGEYFSKPKKFMLFDSLKTFLK